MIDYDKLIEAMGELDEDEVRSTLESVMNDGGGEASKAMEACQEGMNIVGQRFEEGTYFVGDLIFAGELMTEAVEILREGLVSSVNKDKEKTSLILCTVKDDLHDIGKNIVGAMLTAAGFDVIDLGIDVPADKIVQEVKEKEIKIVALSGVLTLAIESMRKTINELKKAGLNEVKVIIGGAPVSEEICSYVGANEWAHSPQKTVKTCLLWAKS